MNYFIDDENYKLDQELTFIHLSCKPHIRPLLKDGPGHVLLLMSFLKDKTVCCRLWVTDRPLDQFLQDFHRWNPGTEIYKSLYTKTKLVLFSAIYDKIQSKLDENDWIMLEQPDDLKEIEKMFTDSD